MKKVFIIFALCCGVTACAKNPALISKSPNEFPSEISNVFLHPKQATLYSIKPYPDIDPETHELKKPPAGSSFYGRQLLGKVLLSDAEETDAFKALQIRASNWDDDRKKGFGGQFACFNPRHIMSVANAKHEYALLICYECEEVDVFKDGKSIMSVFLKPSSRQWLS